MPLPSSVLLTYQHDIYIRYAFLAELVGKVFLSDTAGSLRILDIGCGPERLTERFLPPGTTVVRADVDRFGDDEMVLLTPGEPLPFDGGSFDLVLAMDVLEHVPQEARPFLLAEFQRVASRAVILCCPVDDPAVAAAEKEFQDAVRHLTGHGLPFLDEHAQLRLPSADATVTAFASEWPVVVIENAPLEHWLLLNIVDFLYAKDLGDTAEKQTFNAAVNAESRFRIPGKPHYRRFFCAMRYPADRAALESVLQSPELTAGDNGDGALHALARHLPLLRDDLRRSLEQAIVMKNSYIAQQADQIEALSHLSPASQDVLARVAALSGQVTALSGQVTALSGQVNEVTGRIDLVSRQMEDRLAQFEAKLDARFENLAGQTAALSDLLRTIEASSWKKTLPRLLGPEAWKRRRPAASRKAWRIRAAQAIQAARHGRSLVPLLRPIVRMGLRRQFGPLRSLGILAGSPLFRKDFYTAQNPDVAASGIPPLLHYVERGWREGRKPNPHFDPIFYIRTNPDVAASGIEPLTHYIRYGWREGRRPNPHFDPRRYLEANPDVAASGIEPLTHYAEHGWKEGRPTGLEGGEHAEANGPQGEAAAALYTPPAGLLPWFSPLTIRVDPLLAHTPHLNVLVPGLGMKHMSGGPNTAVNLAYRLAARGVRVRFVATDAPIDADQAPFWRHVRSLSGVGRELPHATLVDASDRTKPLSIGVNDVFMATAWWTAQMVKYALPLTNHRRFVYLIQDYEPLLHPASTQSALAEETYGLDHIPVTNTSLLKEFLAERRIGRHADPAFSERAIMFEPAVDKTRFHPVEKTDGRRTLLFYARPTNGLRNLFEMGVAALQKAIHDGVFDPAEWDFVGMGENFAPVPLGPSAWLKPAPWLDFEGYARQMRESDVLLSLMLSPHPSYPPIEMALCGKPAVTTVFANKTAERLAEVSPNIIGVEPTIEAIADGLSEARRRLDENRCRRDRHGLYPADWDTSFATAVPRLYEELLGLFGAPALPPEARLGDEPANGLFPGYRFWPVDRYALLRLSTPRARTAAYAKPEPGLLSFLTTVWNTDPRYVAELAESVFAQDCGTGFEWILLDNGSVREDTRALLERLGRHPCVRLYRAEENLGIIGGMRYCLERAGNRYIVPLDSDDLLTPDCVRIVTSALARAGYPALAYTDEDKVLDETFRDPYCKPDWDPVLFANSCYIAHLCCIDRRLALELDVYGDRNAEGSHDWDSFTRFHKAGHVPLHIPELVYTWRMHESSTAGNINSKSYITDSQRAVLEKFLGEAAGRFTVEPSPLFDGTPDWVFRRSHSDPRPLTTVILHADGPIATPALDAAIPHEILRLGPDATPADLLEIARASEARGALVHLLWAGTRVEGEEWPWEAMACFELFPDTAIVGGRIHSNGTVVAAGGYLGFGRGCDTPDAGRGLKDAGYFAQMFKMHSVDAVPVQHCVLSAAFLAEALPALVRAKVGLANLGAWLGAEAGLRNRRVVYSPLFLAEAMEPAARPDKLVPEAERVAFRLACRDRLPDRQFLSPRLGLTPETAYLPLSREERRRQEEEARDPGDVPYPELAGAAAIARLVRSPLPVRAPSIAILTSVYEKTPIDCFRELARCLFNQTVPFTEWVLLRNGPVSAELDRVLTELAAEPRVRLLNAERNLGIMGAMRRCLEETAADWIIPMDADDLLAGDALQQVALAIEATAPALLYTDEDILRDGVLCAPYRRPAFDPILNAADSYVWHLCAFRRDKAMALGVYTDAEAEYCHDWDTLTRFAMAGEAIAHIPEILYHWRVHQTSNSNSGTANAGSVRSARHVMDKVIAAQKDPGLYEVAPFPIFRGQEQMAILRRPVSPLPMELLLLPGARPEGGGCLGGSAAALCRSAHRATADGLDGLAEGLAGVTASHVLVLRDGLWIEDAIGLWEAMRLFEMHPDVALVGGRVLDAQDRIVACGAILVPGAETPLSWTGMGRSEPGPFAMALKPQTAVSVPDDVFFAGTAFLRDALEQIREIPPEAGGIGTVLGGIARQQGRRVAYSPLVEARIRR